MPRKKNSPGLPYAVIDNILLSRLVELDIAHFLPFLFKTIRIPREVQREAYKAPHKGKQRLQKIIRQNLGFFVICTEADEMITLYLEAELDAGEAAAIAQADATQAILLLDEEKGYRRAQKMGLDVIRTGRLLILLKAASAIRAVKPYLELLKRTGFHLSQQARNDILVEAGEEN